MKKSYASKKILLLIQLIYVFLIHAWSTSVNAQSLVWAKQQGGTTGDVGYSIAIDGSGNVYTTGYFSGTADFDPGPGVFNLTSAGMNDMFVSKLSSSGNLLWAFKIGGSGNDEGRGIVIVGSTLYITGHFQNTVDFDPGSGVTNLQSNFGGSVAFVGAFNSFGVFIWAKPLGDNAFGYAIAATSSYIYTTGNYQWGDFDPGPGTFNMQQTGGMDIFISKLNTSGDFVWAKSMGGPLSNNYLPESGTSITVDANGNVYTTGNFKGTGDFDPGPGVFDLINTNGYWNVFISKLDSSGNFVWAKQIGGTGDDEANSITLDGSGNIYITGDFTSIGDFDPGIGTYNLGDNFGGLYTYILKLNAAGDFTWALPLGIGNWYETRGNSIKVDATGKVLVMGTFTGTVDMDPGPGTYSITNPVPNYNIWYDTYLVKLSNSGNFIWGKQFGGAGNDYGHAIAIDASGNLYMTGAFSDTADFNPDTAVFNLTSFGNLDMFVLKLSVCLNTPLALITASGPTTFCSPGSVTLNANTGTGLSYQWRLNGINISGATVSSYSATATGNYECIVTNTCASTTSNVIGVTVYSIPPASITAGGSTTFCSPAYVALNANAGAGLNYQWRLNGGNISGATSASYVATTAGNYDCIVTNICGSTTSNIIAVSVLVNCTNGLLFTSSANNRVTISDNASYALGTGDFTLEAWIKASSTQTTFSSVIMSKRSSTSNGFLLFLSSGKISLQMAGNNFISTSNNLRDNTCHHIAVTRAANTVKFYVDGVLVSTHIVASLSINSTHALWIGRDGPTLNPFNGLIHEFRFWNLERSQAQLQAFRDTFLTGSESGLIGYWRMNEGTGQIVQDYSLTNNSGVLGSSVSTENIDPSFSPSCLNPCTPPAASITASGPTIFCTPGSVTLNANTGTGLTYQWKLNGAPIIGATASSFSAATGGNYDCIVTNSCGSTTSNTITVTVDSSPSAAITATGPTTFCSPGSVTLNANTGSGLSYQWRLNGADIFGEVSSSYVATAAGNYDCIVSNICGGSISNVITVMEDILPSAAVTAAGPVTFCSPGSVTLNVSTCTGCTYQWRENFINIPSANAPSFTAASAGIYDCLVTNTCGTRTSNNITVSTDAAPTASIIAAGPTTFCAPGSVTLNANTGTGLSYQWRLNGGNISGATSSSYAATAAGNYDCVVSNTCGNVTSNVISVTVNPLPTANITASGSTTVCSPNSVTLNANTGPGLSYQWRLNGGNISGATASSYNAAATGNYDCVVSNLCGNATSNTIAVTVAAVPATPGTITGQATGVCASTRTYSISPVPGASGYTWTVPAGATISSGQGTTTVNVTFTNSFGSGSVSVVATNSCGVSGASALAVTGVPAQPGNINGPVSVCHNQNNVIYNIAAVTGATSYTWTVPPGTQIKTGQGTVQIKVRFGNSAGNITVRANNACGQGPIRTLAIAMPCRLEEELTDDDFDVTLYPNPATNEFTIYNLQFTIEKIEVFDALGQKIFSQQPTVNSQQLIIDISALPSGIYFAEIISGEQKKVLKFVKQE